MRIKSCSFLVWAHQTLDMKSNIDRKPSLQKRSLMSEASKLKDQVWDDGMWGYTDYPTVLIVVKLIFTWKKC